MRWTTDWWGITFIAENRKDEEMLRSLQAILPRELTPFDTSYGDGIMANSESKDFIESYFDTSSPGEFRLMFHR